MLDTQYYENFIDKQQSKKLYSIIFAEVPWQNEYIQSVPLVKMHKLLIYR